MKMLLLSDGKSLAGPIGQTLVSFVNDPAQSKLAFIATASEVEEDKTYVKEDRARLKKLGFELVEIDLKRPEEFSRLDDCDIIFIEGGSTPYLMEQVRKTEFDKKLKQLLRKDKTYVGVSAGSIMVGPSIQTSRYLDDKKQKAAGLGLVSFSVLPHYSAEAIKHEDDIECVACDQGLPVVAINDEQAILVDEDGTKILGPGELYLWNLPDGLWEIKISF